MTSFYVVDTADDNVRASALAGQDTIKWNTYPQHGKAPATDEFDLCPHHRRR